MFSSICNLLKQKKTMKLIAMGMALQVLLAKTRIDTTRSAIDLLRVQLDKSATQRLASGNFDPISFTLE